MPNGMIKRVSWKRYGYLAFALIILLLSWETNRSNAAVVEPEIPEQAIRLRILANSDGVEDQALKRRIRDAIVEQMNGWVTGPQTIEEAREVVSRHLPELDALVAQQIAANGYDYDRKVELGVVPFPTKMYGNKVYPAGDYEALRVTIGKGEGQNWWCVLFPPLCFVDAVSGEAVAKDGKAAKNGQGTSAEADKASSGKNGSKGKAGETVSPNGGDKTKLAQADDIPQKAALEVRSKKQIRFFFWEKIRSLFA